MSSLGVYSIVLAGWSSGNKYSLLGGLRAAAQMMSYEVFMGMSLMGVVLLAGSFNLTTIVEAQRNLWFIVPQFLGFVLFLIAGVAEARRLPFDLPEAESRTGRGLPFRVFGHEVRNVFRGRVSGRAADLIHDYGSVSWRLEGPLLPPIVWFLIKMFALVCFFILLRATFRGRASIN